MSDADDVRLVHELLKRWADRVPNGPLCGTLRSYDTARDLAPHLIGLIGRAVPEWKPIDTAPRSGFGAPRRYVLVRGPSGMTGIKHFMCLAYHDAQYRPHDPWRDVCNDALSDTGWVPEEWTEPPP